MGDFFRVPCDRRDLNYDKYFSHGDTERAVLSAFTSDNTVRLNIEQVKERLLALPYIQKELLNWEQKI